MRQPILIISLILAGCGTPLEETAPPAPLPQATSTITCGTTAPVIDSFTITDNGLYICEKGQPASPSILLSIAVHDDDGDLTVYELDAVWDTTIDGMFDDSASSYHNIGTLSTDECSVSQTTLGLILCMGGGDPPYSTLVEFGVVVTDELGNVTNYGEPTVTSATTPDPQ